MNFKKNDKNMKKSVSTNEEALASDESKIADDQDLKINDKNEEALQIEQETLIESLDEEAYMEREEQPVVGPSEMAKRIVTIESKNSKFIGEVNENNKRDGIGVVFYKNGDKYVGQFKDGKKNGIGKLYIANGEVFQGEFVNDFLTGFMEYIGKFGIKQGYAERFQFISGPLIYLRGENNFFSIEGDFNVDKENSGYGESKNTKKKLTYTGQLSSWTYHGYGISSVKERFIYQGAHYQGKFTGYGEVFNPDGSKFFGFFKNNLRDGFSIAFCKDGRISFGRYVNDVRNGPFIVSSKSTLRLELWNNGFKSKLIEKFDSAKTYLKSYYPEYEWINKVNFKALTEIFNGVYCDEFKIPNPPPMVPSILPHKKEEKKIEQQEATVKIEEIKQIEPVKVAEEVVKNSLLTESPKTEGALPKILEENINLLELAEEKKEPVTVAEETKEVLNSGFIEDCD
jgi:hypothetical protein